MGVKSSLKKTVTNSYVLSKIFSYAFGNKYYNSEKQYNDEVVRNFKSEEKLADNSYMRRMKRDFLYAHIRNSVYIEEYFRYNFEMLSESGRHEYLPVKTAVKYFDSIEAKGIHKLFRDKYQAYLKFQKYYKRELLAVKSDDDYSDFVKFVNKHKKFIVKPLADCGGHGIYIDSVDNDNIKEKFGKIRSQGESIVEELIVQAPSMAAFYSKAVNTIRIVTYCKNHEIRIVQSSMRIGCGDSVVDNGCLSAGIDYETGTIITKGRLAHKAGLFVFHPDTGYQILGNHIPRWDELKELVKEIPYVVEEQPIIGWDLALTDDGWVMIEANTRPEVQILSGEGIGMRGIVESLENKKL